MLVYKVSFLWAYRLGFVHFSIILKLRYIFSFEGILIWSQIFVFQVGRIMDSPLDHVNERLNKKQRKRTMVDELLADAEFQKYNKKKFKEIIDEKRKSEYRTHMRDKRQRNKQELKKNKVIGKGQKVNKK